MQSINSSKRRGYDHSKSHAPAIKLLMLGDSGVGKSSLMMRYADGDYDPSILSTAGVDFKVKTVFFNDEEYRLQIWDTAGQERFKTITQAYYRGAQGVVVVYDVTDSKSFENVQYWMRSLDSHAQTNVKRLIVANKIDLIDDRKVSEGQGRQLANSMKVDYIETSAQDNIRVDELFLRLGQAVASDPTFNVRKPKKKTGVKVSASNTNKSNKGCC